MARPRQRVSLQDGLKLDLNRLARKGSVRHGANIGGRGITWTHSYWGDIATGMISADMSSNNEGWFRIQLGSLDQWIASLHVRVISVGGNGILFALSGIGSSIANSDPDEWDLPPKPKWMRWATYNRYSDQYDLYEDVLDRGCMALATKFFER